MRRTLTGPDIKDKPAVRHSHRHQQRHHRRRCHHHRCRRVRRHLRHHHRCHSHSHRHRHRRPLHHLLVLAVFIYRIFSESHRHLYIIIM